MDFLIPFDFFLALVEQLGVFLALARDIRDIRHMQKGGALQSDIHKGRLHAGQDLYDAPFIDISYDPVLLPAVY